MVVDRHTGQDRKAGDRGRRQQVAGAGCTRHPHTSDHPDQNRIGTLDSRLGERIAPCL
jgi:hypothetical protein